MEKRIFSGAKLANKAASLVVNKFGTSHLTVEEVQRHFQFHDEDSSTNQITPDGGTEHEEGHKLFNSWHELSIKVDQVKTEGKKVVFTNGCFDILHPGHLSVLRKIKKLADFMVVGLNSDESIRKLKGKGVG